MRKFQTHVTTGSLPRLVKVNADEASVAKPKAVPKAKASMKEKASAKAKASVKAKVKPAKARETPKGSTPYGEAKKEFAAEFFA